MVSRPFGNRTQKHSNGVEYVNEDSFSWRQLSRLESQGNRFPNNPIVALALPVSLGLQWGTV